MLIFYGVILLFNCFQSVKKQSFACFNAQVKTFVSNDPKQLGYSLYEYANNNPLSYADRDGNAPIQVASTVSVENSKILHASVQGLTDDQVNLRFNGKNLELQLIKIPDSYITRPVGTGLIRSIAEHRFDAKVVLDYYNSLAHETVGTQTSVQGFAIKDKYGSFSYQHQGETYDIAPIARESIINFEKSAYPNAYSTFLGTDNQLLVGRVAQYSPDYIVIGHELIHANRSASFPYYVTDNNKSNMLTKLIHEHGRRPFPTSSNTESVPWEELITIGLHRNSPVNSTQEAIDLSSRFSENALRRENNLPLRLSYRPAL